MIKTPNDGGPAFPVDDAKRGMSLLDYFAGQALSNPSICHTNLSLKECIEEAYLHAREMLSYKQNQQAVSESQQVALGIGKDFT